MAIEQQIFDELYTILTAELTWASLIERDNPKVSILGIESHEIPLVQFFWNNVSVQQQQRGLSVTTAPLRIEVITKDTKNLTMTQNILFGYKEDVVNAVSSDVNLYNVPGFRNFLYTGVNYDIHSFKDFYVAQIDFQALFDIPFGSC